MEDTDDASAGGRGDLERGGAYRLNRPITSGVMLQFLSRRLDARQTCLQFGRQLRNQLVLRHANRIAHAAQCVFDHQPVVLLA